MTCNIDSSIVTEPNYLDIRNLPQSLKDSVNKKLNNTSLSFNSKWNSISKNTKQFQIESWYAHLKSIQNYMNSADPNLNLWKQFLEYTQLFDNMAGMNILDSIAHAMTTIATGGFSTYNESIGYFQNPKIEIVSIIFIILGSIPFIAYLKYLKGNKKISPDN